MTINGPNNSTRIGKGGKGQSMELTIAQELVYAAKDSQWY